MAFARQKAARFREGRRPQPDDHFVAGCGLPSGSETGNCALAVRRAIARVGSVEPEFVRHDHRWPEDLGTLDIWDSIDYLSFIVEVERELGCRIPPKPGPEEEALREWFYSGFVVTELVQRVLELLEPTLPNS